MADTALTLELISFVHSNCRVHRLYFYSLLSSCAPRYLYPEIKICLKQCRCRIRFIDSKQCRYMTIFAPHTSSLLTSCEELVPSSSTLPSRTRTFHDFHRKTILVVARTRKHRKHRTHPLSPTCPRKPSTPPKTHQPSQPQTNTTTSLKKLALKLGTDGPVKTLPTPRKIQILFSGLYILKTTSAIYVWEHPYYPQYYLPLSELVASSKKVPFTLTPGEEFASDNGTAIATQYSITAGNESTDNVLAFSSALTGKAQDLAGLVRIDFGSMQQWFEEETPIHVHPKDPFKRIDILSSVRDIRVSIDGHTLAHTQTSMHLYETGLPVRYYLPLTSVDASVLRASETRTRCPYKGEAEYYSVEVGGKVYEDLFWFYVNPTLESAGVRGLVCPYSERVDLEVDGVKVERPKTPFGAPKEGRKPSAVD